MARRLVAMTSALVLSLGLAACSDAEPTPPPKSTTNPGTQPAGEPRTLTFGAFGHPDELRAFEQVV